MTIATVLIRPNRLIRTKIGAIGWNIHLRVVAHLVQFPDILYFE
jgi:hypothetical protein